MKDTDSKKLEVLYDHYKDTSLQVIELNKYRERLFVYVLAIIFLQFVQISFSTKFVDLSNALLQKQIGINFELGQELLNGFLWFLLFSISFRYFQNNVLVNRLYSYLHKLEEKMGKLASDSNFITREGKNYLNGYPAFSDWAHFVYTWLFPLLLLTVASIRMFFCRFFDNQSPLSLHIGGFFLLTIYISTILYMVAVHQKSK